MARNRFDNAIAITEGACNPSGIALSLAAACKECLDQGVSQRTDPAVRLIAYQLAYILNVREFDDSLSAFGEALNACRAHS
jgi:hypothetical protein